MSEGVLQVEVVSREGRLWHGRGTAVRVPAADGALGILPRRQPLLASLAPGEVVVDTEDGERRTFQVDSGFVSVDSDFVTVVADHGSVA
ncbi:F0F1 ATP synthase subunit epsilon [Actinomyces polynesiensis]|uniref:F0F1 ATP synthase subunit epsilon n=1 Tax=Actinomyces polynesiensis TaxID=1325934 RepID=UPI0005BE94C2|nr:F0F1 ATP synthase subunit epsilon [Actinomyces polynesiensis]